MGEEEKVQLEQALDKSNSEAATEGEGKSQKLEQLSGSLDFGGDRKILEAIVEDNDADIES